MKNTKEIAVTSNKKAQDVISALRLLGIKSGQIMKWGRLYRITYELPEANLENYQSIITNNLKISQAIYGFSQSRVTLQELLKELN